MIVNDAWSDGPIIRKDCFLNKSQFITEDYFTKHMNIITIRIIKAK